MSLARLRNLCPSSCSSSEDAFRYTQKIVSWYLSLFIKRFEMLGKRHFHGPLYGAMFILQHIVTNCDILNVIFFLQTFAFVFRIFLKLGKLQLKSNFKKKLSTSTEDKKL